MTILLALILITLIFGGDFVLGMIKLAFGAFCYLAVIGAGLGALGLFAYALVNMI